MILLMIFFHVMNIVKYAISVFLWAYCFLMMIAMGEFWMVYFFTIFAHAFVEFVIQKPLYHLGSYLRKKYNVEY